MPTRNVFNSLIYSQLWPIFLPFSDSQRGAVLAKYRCLGYASALVANHSQQEDFGTVVDFEDPHNTLTVFSGAHLMQPPLRRPKSCSPLTWGQGFAHYHGFLKGENTLNWQLANLLQRNSTNRVLPERLPKPTKHSGDEVTAIPMEECHRGYFPIQADKLLNAQWKKNTSVDWACAPARCIAFTRDPDKAKQLACEHLAICSPRKSNGRCDGTRVNITATIASPPLRRRRLSQQDSPFSVPLLSGESWMTGLLLDATSTAIGQVQPRCVAYKYADTLSAAIVNTNLGGNNVHRGMVLESLGAEMGRKQCLSRGLNWWSTRLWR